MNEFVTDLEKTVQTTCHEAGDELATAMKRGKGLYMALGRRVGKDVHAANAAMHENPYPTMLVGIGAGAVIGYLVACSMKSANSPQR